MNYDKAVGILVDVSVGLWATDTRKYKLLGDAINTVEKHRQADAQRRSAELIKSWMATDSGGPRQ